MTPKKIGRKARVSFQAAPALLAWLQAKAGEETLTVSEYVERLLWLARREEMRERAGKAGKAKG